MYNGGSGKCGHCSFTGAAVGRWVIMHRKLCAMNYELNERGAVCLKRGIAVLSLAFALIIVLAACLSNGSGTGSGSPPSSGPAPQMDAHENDAKLFAELYPVTADNPYIFASYEELIDLLDRGTGIVAFGFPA